MKVVDRFPYDVETIEHVPIRMPDGCRLSARIWRPRTNRPVPAIVEVIPYRKRDAIRKRDEPIHRYFAGHGYAAIRIDVRGTGESEGLLRDEYSEEEIADGLASLGWLASQSWCSGKVGLFGKSWGGINALQIAARNPPELGAVLTVCSTDDRYGADAHYMGGALLSENLLWGSALFTLCALPPDPEIAGDGWRETWLQRLEALRFFAKEWLSHPHRDATWKRESVCEDYGAIRVPVYAVGGWMDPYAGTVLRLLAGLSVPRKGLIGPWTHLYPHVGAPGPAIGFLQEALRWFDHWLLGRDTGILEEPSLRVFMQRPFKDSIAERPGIWAAEPSWPSPRIVPKRFHLDPTGLHAHPPSPSRVEVRTFLDHGQEGGSWCPFGIDDQLPGDQRPDDARSAVFDTEPLETPIAILGVPHVVLELACDRTAGQIVARLCDVAPSGASERVAYGVLNLTHREGHDRPSPLTPGERVAVRVPLTAAGHVFEKGRRIRLALSLSYWPIVWPSADLATITLFTESCVLELPLRPERPEDAMLVPFGPPEAAPPARITERHPTGTARSVERHPGSGAIVETVATDINPDGDPVLTTLEDFGLEIGHGVVERNEIIPRDPLSASFSVLHRTLLRRGGWSVRVETQTRLHATAEDFRIEADLVALEGDEPVFSRQWRERVPRDGL